MTNTLKVSAIQVAPVFLNLEESLIRAETEITKAAENGAHLVAFAECWLTGYPVWLDFADKAGRWGNTAATALYTRLAREAVVLGGAATDRLQAVADKTGTVIAMGTHEKRGGTLTNTAMTFVPGEETPSLRRKLVPTYTERLVWGRGDGSTLSAASTPFGRVSTLICWEHWMPALRTTTHAEHPSVHVSQWPVVSDPHLLASRHIAFEGRVPVVAAGSYITLDDCVDGYTSGGDANPDALAMLKDMDADTLGQVHRGGSTIVGPDGALLTDQLFDAPGHVSASLDLDARQAGHLTLDVDGHYSRPDIFELSVNVREQKTLRERS